MMKMGWMIGSGRIGYVDGIRDNAPAVRSSESLLGLYKCKGGEL